MAKPVRFPEITVTGSDLAGLEPYRAMSEVTAQMWTAGVDPADMENYCAEIEGLSSVELVERSRDWVTVV